MRLDILKDNATAPAHLLAMFAQATADFLSLGLEPEPIDLGLALATPALARLHDANCVTGARVPPGSDADTLLSETADWFASRGVRLQNIVPNPLAAEGERAPLEAALRRQGWHAHRRDVLRLTHAAAAPPPTISVLSARAMMRPYERFCEAVAADKPQLAALSLLRLDDPRFDALVALREGRVVARAGLLSLGETGLIENVVTHPDFHRRGFARAVMGRAIDGCARSQFKHVLLGCDPSSAPAQSLYASLGFKKIGEHVEWRSPTVPEHA